MYRADRHCCDTNNYKTSKWFLTSKSKQRICPALGFDCAKLQAMKKENSVIAGFYRTSLFLFHILVQCVGFALPEHPPMQKREMHSLHACAMLSCGANSTGRGVKHNSPSTPLL